MARPDTPAVNFEAMYRSEISSVYGFLSRLGAPKADLPDLTHDVFTTAIKKWSRYDPARPVRPWLLGIAWRVASDHRSRKQPEVVAELPEVEDPTDLDAPLAARDASRLLQRGLSQLDEIKRAAFVMHELQGLSVSEISEAMSAPVQTTYSRLKAARDELGVAVRRLTRGEP